MFCPHTVRVAGVYYVYTAGNDGNEVEHMISFSRTLGFRLSATTCNHARNGSSCLGLLGARENNASSRPKLPQTSV
eukprot:2584042-Amphidinium_carterae.1